MTIQNTLQGLGLEEKEARTYLALLELGEGTILEISRKSGIKRPTTYVVLRSLEEKGFVSRILKGKKALYSPQHPKKLITEAEVRLKELREVVPQLESLAGKASNKPRVMIYEGKDRLDQAYDEMFITKGEMLFIGNIALSQEVFPRTFRKYQYKSSSP
jgi:sugar-specific transcriptional regulator TrmB